MSYYQNQQQNQPQRSQNQPLINLNPGGSMFNFSGEHGQATIPLQGGTLLIQQQQSNQQQPQPNFPGLNFITDGLGVGQIITQSAAAQNQTISMQNLGVSPMSVAIGHSGMSFAPPIQVLSQTPPPNTTTSTASKQRVFTGTVTKTHDNFGFIDDEVFFQMQVVKGPILPKAGDRVLVEADFNPAMPFKWTATRVQIVNIGGALSNMNQQQSNQQSHQQQQQQQQQQQHTNFNNGPPSQQQIQMKGGGPPIISTQTQNPNSRYTNPPPQMYGVGVGPGPQQQQQQQQLRAGGGIGPNLNVQPARGGLTRPPLQGILKHQSPIQQQMPPQQHQQQMLQQDRDHDRDRELQRERDREKERERERERERDRERREREKEREQRERDREREREKERRDRLREKELDNSRVERRPRERSPRKRSRSRSPRDVRRSSNSNTTPKFSTSKERNDVRSEARKISSRSPSPKRSTVRSTRYNIEIPKVSLDVTELDVSELKRRYPHLYIPSDLFLAKACWVDSCPIDRPLDFIDKLSPVHIFRKQVERIEIPIDGNKNWAKYKQVPDELEPDDASPIIKVKVMLLSLPGQSELLRKTGISTEEKTDNPLHINKIIHFVVGIKTGKSETMAIGGNWSPSLDGINPESDPKVLVRTAIRCVKNLVGLDLTRCSQWLRFSEYYFRRSNGNLETTVILLPDVWTSLPKKSEWPVVVKSYERALFGGEKPSTSTVDDSKSKVVPTNDNKSRATTTTVDKISTPITSGLGEVSPVSTIDDDLPMVMANGSDDKMKDDLQENENEITTLDIKTESDSNNQTTAEVKEKEIEPEEPATSTLETVTTVKMEVDDPEQAEDEEKLDSSFDEKDGGSKEDDQKVSTDLDPKNLSVVRLREELTARGIETKKLKLKHQLVTRLNEALAVKVGDGEKNDQEPISATDQDENNVQNGEVKMETEEQTTTGNESKDQQEITPSLTDSTIPIPTKNAEQNESSLESEIYKLIDKTYSEPVIKPGMDIKNQKVLEKRYLPPRRPSILLHPSKTAKNGQYDLTVMSLATLKDYRLADNKEQSFEVSLFAEFFNEMLQRDFGYKIYQDILKMLNCSSPALGGIASSSGEIDENGEKDKTVEESKVEDQQTADVILENSSSLTPNTPKDRKRKLSTSSSTNQSGIMSSSSTLTLDPRLHLSFLYFDMSRCGYLSEGDMEDLFLALGLGLNRGQLRKMLNKFMSKGNLSYKSLNKINIEPNDVDIEAIKQMAFGSNKTLLPVFAYDSKEPYSFPDLYSTGTSHDQLRLDEQNEQEEPYWVTIDGNTVDVKKLTKKLTTVEREKSSTEAQLNVLKISYNDQVHQLTELKKTYEIVKDELNKSKESLKKSEIAEKANKESVEVFRRATERFYERIKEHYKPPSCPAITNSSTNLKVESECTPTKDKKEKEKDKFKTESIHSSSSN